MTLYDAVLNSNTCDRTRVHPCCMDAIQKNLSNNVDVPYDFKTPLYIAEHLPVIELLIQNGANLNGVKREGYDNTYYFPPIFNAIGTFNYRKLELLLSLGADPDVVGDTNTHDNALFFAVSLIDIRSFELLTTFGASLTDSLGNSVLTFCIRSLHYASHEETYHFSRSYSLEPGCKDNLFYMITSLIKKGAKVKIYDVVNACANGYLGLAKYLLSHTSTSNFTYKEDLRDFYQTDVLYSIIYNYSRSLDIFIFYIYLIRGAFSRRLVKKACKYQIKRSKNSIDINYYDNLTRLMDDNSFPSLFHLLSFQIEISIYMSFNLEEPSNL